jgi:two-component system chemotaxis response regulator CheY
LIKRTPPPTGGETAGSAQTDGPLLVKLCLIVDDSRMIRKISRRIVESLGYEVSEAENGQEALAKCEDTMPDLVLLDWEMPVMTGVECVAALRRMTGGHRPKVVFCTMKGTKPDIREGLEAGADEYVIKPFDYDIMLAKLQRIGAI